MLEKILEKRRFTRLFSHETYPEKELVNNLIEKTFDLVPSKQNIIPYYINIFGPEHVETKEKIIEMSFRSYHKKDLGFNPNTQLKAPYLLVFCNRLVTHPNKWVETLIKAGRQFKVCDKKEYSKTSNLKDVSLEIGMFAMILTQLSLEKNIDTAYTLCHFNDPKNQNIVKDRVLLIMSLGYATSLIDQEIRKKAYVNRGETKPKLKDVMIWK